MIETTATLIMIVSEGVRIPPEVHTLLARNGYGIPTATSPSGAIARRTTTQRSAARDEVIQAGLDSESISKSAYRSGAIDQEHFSRGAKNDSVMICGLML
jgi:hypothetical protein